MSLPGIGDAPQRVASPAAKMMKMAERMVEIMTGRAGIAESDNSHAA